MRNSLFWLPVRFIHSPSSNDAWAKQLHCLKAPTQAHITGSVTCFSGACTTQSWTTPAQSNCLRLRYIQSPVLRFQGLVMILLQLLQQLGTEHPLRPSSLCQQLCAEGHSKKRCSMVSSAPVLHMTHAVLP